MLYKSPSYGWGNRLQEISNLHEVIPFITREARLKESQSPNPGAMAWMVQMVLCSRARRG